MSIAVQGNRSSEENLLFLVSAHVSLVCFSCTLIGDSFLFSFLIPFSPLLPNFNFQLSQFSILPLVCFSCTLFGDNFCLLLQFVAILPIMTTLFHTSLLYTLVVPFFFYHFSPQLVLILLGDIPTMTSSAHVSF